MAIEFYKEFGDLGYLANYSNHGFVIDGVFYKTVEHYYQSQKFFDASIEREVIMSDVPKTASNIGRDRNRVRKINFKNIKNQIMFNGVLEKFRQNRDIAYKLIGTRNEEIIEATVDEYYWGIGKDRTGLNVIGNILEEVREMIKYEILNSMLKKCLGKEIYILGHDNPDADSLISSYLLANILKSFGVDAKFALRNDSCECIGKDSGLVKNYFKEQPVIIDSAKDKNFILVDHNSLDGLPSNSVIGAIDHHMVTGDVYDTLSIEYASTALFIYDLFKGSYEFSDDEKYLIGVTVLADTDYLRSKRFSAEDKKIYDSLILDIQVDKVRSENFSLCDFDESIQTNLMWDFKIYNKDDKLINRSCIYSSTSDFINYYEEYINYIKRTEGVWLLIWVDIEEEKTYVWYDGQYYDFDRVITSTNLIFKLMKNKENCYVK